jgi:hypothetical protein
MLKQIFVYERDIGRRILAFRREAGFKQDDDAFWYAWRDEGKVTGQALVKKGKTIEEASRLVNFADLKYLEFSKLIIEVSLVTRHCCVECSKVSR